MKKHKIIIGSLILGCTSLVGCATTSRHVEPKNTESTITVKPETKQIKDFDQIEKNLKNDFDNKNIEVQRISPLSIGVYFNRNMTFKVQDATPTQALKNNLLPVMKSVIDYQNVEIVVNGHTDNSGYNPINNILSDKRAYNVGHYMTSHGMPRYRVLYDNWADKINIKNNDTRNNKQLNRRVEILIKPIYNY